jgi:hypothetical protein
MPENNFDKLPNLHDVNNWIYECNRFLFYGKIRLEDPTFNMKFYEDPITYIERLSSFCKLSEENSESQNNLLLLEPREKSRKIPSQHEINIVIPTEKITELNLTINLIKSGDWDHLNARKIEKCQKILLKSFNDLKRQVEKIQATP